LRSLLGDRLDKIQGVVLKVIEANRAAQNDVQAGPADSTDSLPA
jgi:hypothetical protein